MIREASSTGKKHEGCISFSIYMPQKRQMEVVMKYLAIVGTNSDVSTNRMLLQFMQKHFSNEAEIEVYEIKELPAFMEPEDSDVPER